MRLHQSAYVSIRQHTSAYVSICQHTSAFTLVTSPVTRPIYLHMRLHQSAYVSIRQHTLAYAAYVRIRQHTSAYVSIRQYMSAYVSRQHTSAYVSIRQHTSAYVHLHMRLNQRRDAPAARFFFFVHPNTHERAAPLLHCLRPPTRVFWAKVPVVIRAIRA
jgi:hypothetical protein